MKFPREEALRKLIADTLRLNFANYLKTDEFSHLLVEHGVGNDWRKLNFDADLASVMDGHMGRDIEIVKLMVGRADEDATWRLFYLAALSQFLRTRHGVQGPQLAPLLESMKKLGWPEGERKKLAMVVEETSRPKLASDNPPAPKQRSTKKSSPQGKDKSTMPKSRLFIGSSREGLPIANAIHTNLQREFECTVWTHGVFGLSKSNIEALEQMARASDLAVIVVSPDDTTISRGKSASTPRDNVVFELGLFMGALGRDRTFAVQPQNSKLKVPSDLFGITFAEYEDGRSDGNWEAALGPACIKIQDAARIARPKGG